MNLKARFKNLNIRLKSTQSKSNMQQTSRSLNTEILRIGIVFCLILAFNTGHSQCTVFDLPDTTQNKIVKAFIDLKECEAKSVESGKRVIDLMISNEELNRTNLLLNQKLIRRRRAIVFVSVGSLIGGIWLGTKIK